MVEIVRRTQDLGIAVLVENDTELAFNLGADGLRLGDAEEFVAPARHPGRSGQGPSVVESVRHGHARGKEAASAAGAEAASAGASAVESLRCEIKTIQELVTRLAAQSGREAANVAAAAADRIGDVAGDLARSGANAAAAATDRAKSLGGELEGMARRNPMGVIAGAVVIGVLIGVFGRSRS